MTEIPDVTPGGTIQTAWGNQIRDRALMRYANAAARDASNPIPASGDMAWLLDVDRLTIYTGAVWVEYFSGNPVNNGSILTASVAGTEDLTSTSIVNWPSNLVATGTVPPGMTRLMATATISGVDVVTDVANHRLQLDLDGLSVNSTRVRFVIGGGSADINLATGARSVTPGAAFTLRTQGQRVAGSGALRIEAEKTSFIDYRFDT